MLKDLIGAVAPNAETINEKIIPMRLSFSAGDPLMTIFAGNDGMSWFRIVVRKN